VISLADYNRIEKKNETLSDNEVFIFAKGSDFGYNRLILGDSEYKVKKELKQVVFEKKATRDRFGQDYYLIMRDDAPIEKLRTEFKSSAVNDQITTVRFQLAGAEEGKKKFESQISKWVSGQKGYNSTVDGISGREDAISMTGGLLFLGIFFSIVFSMCLILIMYYKQITEGYDDRENFDIMQKVGMSDPEVRSTIKKQILMVFFLPLIIAICHTAAAFTMISGLLSVLYLFDNTLIILCGIAVVCLFALLYGLSYLVTSKTYYGIVRQMN
jgi:putative ABC transport system permease protein